MADEEIVIGSKLEEAFRRKLEAKLKSALRGTDQYVTIKAKMDTGSSLAQFNDFATKSIKAIQQLEAQKQTELRKSTQEQVRIEAASLRDRFSQVRNYNERVERDHTRALVDYTKREVQATERQVKEEDRRQKEVEKRRSRGILGGLGALGGARPINVLQGIGIGLAAANIAPITAALVGLSVAAATAGAGIGTFSIAAIGHIAQLTQVMKQVNEQGQQLQDLPAPFQKMIPALTDFQSKWNVFLTNTREPVFDTFIKGLTIAEGLLQKFTPVVNTVARSVSAALSSVGQFAGGSEVQRFLNVVQVQAPAAIQSLARSAVNLGAGLLNIFSDFAPAGQKVLDLIETLTLRFSKWAASLQTSPEFQQFLGYIQNVGPKVVDVLVNMATFAGKLIAGLAPLGAVAILVAQGFSKLLSIIPPVVWEAISVAVLTFVGIMKFSTVVDSATKALSTLRTVLPSLAAALGIAEGATISLTVAMKALSRATLIGLAIGAAVTLITSLVTSNTEAADATIEHASAVDTLTAALQRNNGVIDENTKAEIANNLIKSKVIGAPGVNPQKAVAGALGDKKAFADTVKALDDVTAARKRAWEEAAKHEIDVGSTKESQKATEAAEKAYREAEKTSSSYKQLGGASEDAARNTDLFNQAMGKTPGAANAAAGGLDTLLSRYQKLVALTDEEQLGQAITDTYSKWEGAQRSLARATLQEANTRRDADRANIEATKAVRNARESLAEAQKQAAQAAIDAEQRMKDAVDSQRKAVEDLAEARRKAAQELADQADKELSASVNLEKAKQEAAKAGVYFGPLVADQQLRQQSAAIALRGAQKDLTRTKEEGDLLRQRGIEGSPDVINARKALDKANADLTRAEKDRTETLTTSKKNLRNAQEALNDAIYNQQRTFEQGKQSAADAHQATVDAANAEKVAQGEYIKSKKALEKLGDQFDVTAGQRDGLSAKLQEQLQLNAGNVPAQLQLISQWIDALKIAAGDPKMSWQQAWDAAGTNQRRTAPTTPSAPKEAKPGGRTPGTFLALGGPVVGQGSGTSDSIPALLSNNEHVWTAEEVYGIGGHENVKKLRTIAKYGKHMYAAGGPVSPSDFPYKGSTIASLEKLPFGDMLVRAGLLDLAAAAHGALPKGAAAGGNLGSASIALAAYTVAKSMGASNRALLALFEAGVVETGFKNYANSTVPESMKIPHDAVGSDHDSVGFLQQRAGWGSVSQRMDASYAARKFLEKAIAYDPKFRGTAGQLAQKVQVSAFPDRYDQEQARAQTLIALAVSQAIGAVPGASKQHYTLADKPIFGIPLIGSTGPVAGFPPWPSSPLAQRGDTGVWRNIVSLINSTGPASGSFGNAYRAGDPLWHGSGRAVDWMGYQQDALATFLASKSPLELIHRTSKRDYAYTRGKDKGSFNQALMEAHRNHVHIAMKYGGPVLSNNGTVIADKGAVLPPRSRTVVENHQTVPERVGNGDVTQNITINNPIPERTSESLPKTLRRASNRLGGY